MEIGYTFHPTLEVPCFVLCVSAVCGGVWEKEEVSSRGARVEKMECVT